LTDNINTIRYIPDVFYKVTHNRQGYMWSVSFYVIYKKNYKNGYTNIYMDNLSVDNLYV